MQKEEHFLWVKFLDSLPKDGEARAKKKKSRWGGSENDKTFIPGMPTILPATLDSHQQEAYLGDYSF